MLVVSRNQNIKVKGQIVAALGNFDGFHIGHATIIDHVIELSEKLKVVPSLISFYPHPRVVLGYDQELKHLSNLHLDVSFLEKAGIESYVLLHFTKSLSKLGAKDFISEILVKKLKVSGLVLGPDARIGKDREGTPEFIEKVCNELGIAVLHVKAENLGFEKISSSYIRQLVAKGDLTLVSQLLSRNYAISGRVMHGDKRGREIGFPTANIYVPDQILPPNGVYVGRALLRGREYKAACNIGMRPTFNGNSIKVEVHLIGYSEKEFYNDRIGFSFSKKIRDEIKFASKDDLIKQIGIDIERAKKE